MQFKDCNPTQQGASRERFITEKELAARWAISVRTLQNGRSSGAGPEIRHFKIGKSVRYRLSDVELFERLNASTLDGREGPQ